MRDRESLQNKDGREKQADYHGFCFNLISLFYDEFKLVEVLSIYSLSGSPFRSALELALARKQSQSKGRSTTLRHFTLNGIPQGFSDNYFLYLTGKQSSKPSICDEVLLNGII